MRMAVFSFSSQVLERILFGSDASNSFGFHSLDELADADHGPAHRAASDFLRVVAGGHAQGIKMAVKRFEHGLGFDAGADAAGGAMFNVDGCSDSDLIAFAVGLQRMKGRGFHQPDHVRRRIDRRQFGMVGGERVLEIDRLRGLAASSNGMSLSQLFLPEKKRANDSIESLARNSANKSDADQFADYATAIAVRRASIPSSAFHSMRAAASPASRAASAASGWAAIRFSSCVRHTRAW